ncbi:MAG: galactokinase [Opitutaceae bacterium]
MNIKKQLLECAAAEGLDISGGQIRRSSSRFCLGVEHGDYNGCELFGVGTDRFIWLAFKPNNSGKVRIFSENFAGDGLIEFELGNSAKPGSMPDSWARFPHGVEWVLRREGYSLSQGFDAVLYGNIPGGGMSRSASLSLNLIETFFEVNGIVVEDGMRVVDLAQMVENDYIGSPCGKLDQIMIYFAKEGMGTYFNPRTNRIEHIPFGGDADSFRIVSLDTGTKRPGLEKSTYKLRRNECDELTEFLGTKLGFSFLADINSEKLYAESLSAIQGQAFAASGSKRIKYLYEAQQRFYDTLEAWRAGDIERVGRNFRADGLGLRDDYEISGRELESMCDIARTVEGVYGERMLGGGDKGASGALVKTDAFEPLKATVERAYPMAHPDYSEEYAVHACRTVDGIVCESLDM